MEFLLRGVAEGLEKKGKNKRDSHRHRKRNRWGLVQGMPPTLQTKTTSPSNLKTTPPRLQGLPSTGPNKPFCFD